VDDFGQVLEAKFKLLDPQPKGTFDWASADSSANLQMYQRLDQTGIDWKDNWRRSRVPDCNWQTPSFSYPLSTTDSPANDSFDWQHLGTWLSSMPNWLQLDPSPFIWGFVVISAVLAAILKVRSDRRHATRESEEYLRGWHAGHAAASNQDDDGENDDEANPDCDSLGRHHMPGEVRPWVGKYGKKRLCKLCRDFANAEEAWAAEEYGRGEPTQDWSKAEVYVQGKLSEFH
jgi:hypothetical protein